MTSTMPQRSHTVGPKGQVVIPKAIRDELDIRPGDPVDFIVDGGAVRITLAPSGSLLGMFAGPDSSEMIEWFEADKALDRAKEDGPR